MDSFSHTTILTALVGGTFLVGFGALVFGHREKQNEVNIAENEPILNLSELLAEKPSDKRYLVKVRAVEDTRVWKEQDAHSNEAKYCYPNQDKFLNQVVLHYNEPKRLHWVAQDVYLKDKKASVDGIGRTKNEIFEV